MASRARQVITATADGAGVATFTFEAPAPGRVLVGSIGIPAAPSSAVSTLVIGPGGLGLTWGSWSGNATFGPAQAFGSESMTVDVVGLDAGVIYEAVFIGYEDEDGPETTIIYPSALATAVAADVSSTTTIGARVTLGAVQAIPNAAGTAIQFTQAQFDSSGFFDAGTPTRLTVPAGLGGVYAITGYVLFAASGVGIRQSSIPVNAAATHAINGPLPGNGAFNNGLPVPLTLALAAGDFVELEAYQSSGGALNALAGTNATSLALVRIGT